MSVDCATQQRGFTNRNPSIQVQVMDVFSTVTVIIRGGVNQPAGWAPGQPVDDRSLGAATVTTEWTGDNSSTSEGPR